MMQLALPPKNRDHRTCLVKLIHVMLRHYLNMIEYSVFFSLAFWLFFCLVLSVNDLLGISAKVANLPSVIEFGSNTVSLTCGKSCQRCRAWPAGQTCSGDGRQPGPRCGCGRGSRRRASSRSSTIHVSTFDDAIHHYLTTYSAARLLSNGRDVLGLRW